VKRYIREPGSDWIQDLFAQQPLLAIEIRLDTDTLAFAAGVVREYALRGPDSV
jgi:hypothetical protein